MTIAAVVMTAVAFASPFEDLAYKTLEESRCVDADRLRCEIEASCA